MADTDGLHLVIGPGWIRIENAWRNFLRFITRVLQGDGFRCVDREKFRLATRPGGRGDGVGSYLAVERTDSHEGVEARVTRQLLELASAELSDRDLVRLHTGGAQDDSQQRGVRRGRADHPHPAPCEIGDLLDFGRRLSLGALARNSRRRPQHDEILAQDDDCLRVCRHFQIAAADRKVGLAGTEQSESFGRPGGHDRRQLYSPAFVGKGLGHRLDHLVIVASRRSDGNPESYRPQRVIQCTRSGSENEKSDGQNQQQGLRLSPPSAGCVTAYHRGLRRGHLALPVGGQKSLPALWEYHVLPKEDNARAAGLVSWRQRELWRPSDVYCRISFPRWARASSRLRYDGE